MLVTKLIRDFFIAMLSRFMGEYSITCNFRIKGHGEAFTVGEGEEVPPCTVVFNGLLAFCLFASSPSLLTFAKLYIDGHVDGEGDWFAFAEVIDKIGDKDPTTLGKLLGRLAKALKIGIHYGWSAEAFACFLNDDEDDKFMQYTSGRNGSQLNKLRFAAQCVRVGAGKRHLDVGCGWGGLIRYFVEKYGTVSHGVTIAPEQASYARGQVSSEQAKFFVADFSEYTPSEPYDSGTVVGCVEHIPVDRHPEFFEWLAARLRDGGRVYLQCITRLPTRPVGIRTHLLNMFVFEHELTTLAELKKLARAAGFEVELVEEGHEDYAVTTRQWVERMQAREAEIKQLLNNDKVYRTLLGYLTMASLVMADNRCNLHRLVLVKK